MTSVRTSARTALVIAAVLSAAACGDAVSPEAAPTPGDITVREQGLEAHVMALAHDSMCGRLVATRYERRAAEYVADGFARAGLDPGGPDGSYFQTVAVGAAGREVPAATTLCRADTAYPSRNVLGFVPGRGGLAAQWVVVGAHYDHLGWVPAGGGTLVYNGADDNASGTALVLELARLYAAWVAAHPDAAPARRGVMFQTYGAEEIGLFGSMRFAALPTVSEDSLYAMLNFDMVGRLRDETLTIGGATSSPSWPALLRDAREDGVDVVYSNDALDRSDQWSFIQQGVPAIHFFTGLHDDYHTPRDDAAELNYGGMRRIGQMALDVLWTLVTRPEAM